MAPGKKRSVAEQIAKSFEPEESIDPADVDSLGDETAAGQRRFGGDGLSAGIAPQKGRLQMRAKVPVIEAYSGKTISRKQMFGEEQAGAEVASRAGKLQASPFLDEADEFEDRDDDDDDAALGTSSAFNISGDMEKEYQKMMRNTQRELEVMRQPSAEDLARKEDEAKALKNQLEVWGSLVQLRIHLEGVLGIGHRLPAGADSTSFRSDGAVAEEVNVAAEDARSLVGSLLSLQQDMTRHHVSMPSMEETSSKRSEVDAWSLVDERLQPVLDWALGVADHWKERTRLDSRRSFKVLDQSLRLQMQAVAETEPEKLRKRCTPPPGKHKVFRSSPATAKKAAEGEADAAESNAEDDEGAQDIFDDRDFYVQLLREVLSSSSGSAFGADGADDKELRAELQGRRATKRKARAEVERRASKGRKIRYRPIEKLQNFMASRPRGAFRNGNSDLGLEEVEPLTDTACEALLSSLFARPKVTLV
eukprot:TRINITY_DN39863_c0_g1_i1.p1 TRINITY_DN39863_c0_g1~~TRINITY_DN39863_c0_g1_i1.p1  ORF type:complete len:477 (+),score=141.30 TRINITY_DN39863_c0_g1_i1:36-1466(+)